MLPQGLHPEQSKTNVKFLSSTQPRRKLTDSTSVKALNSKQPSKTLKDSSGGLKKNTRNLSKTSNILRKVSETSEIERFEYLLKIYSFLGDRADSKISNKVTSFLLKTWLQLP